MADRVKQLAYMEEMNNCSLSSIKLQSVCPDMGVEFIYYMILRRSDLIKMGDEVNSIMHLNCPSMMC